MKKLKIILLNFFLLFNTAIFAEDKMAVIKMLQTNRASQEQLSNELNAEIIKYESQGYFVKDFKFVNYDSYAFLIIIHFTR